MRYRKQTFLLSEVLRKVTFGRRQLMQVSGATLVMKYFEVVQDTVTAIDRHMILLGLVFWPGEIASEATSAINCTVLALEASH